jgi:DNA polymerase II large subunit
MIILNRFLTTGVQLRIELPGKSAAVTPVDSIEPPIVKLDDNSVLRVESAEEAERVIESVEKILFLGDVLISVGDFIQNNKDLLPSGYDESQWRLDLEMAVNRDGFKLFVEKSGLPPHMLEILLKNNSVTPSPKEAIALSECGVPLHPRYTYLWSQVSKVAFLRLRDNLASAWPRSEPFLVSLDEQDKGTLEDLLVPHTVSDNRVQLSEVAPILERCLALDRLYIEAFEGNPLEIVRSLSGIDLKEKVHVFVGCRMGRPEKARERKMSPYLHVLFPVESAGGAQRDITKTMRRRAVSVDMINRSCPKCGVLSFGVRCHNCGVETVIKWMCPRCGKPVEGKLCPVCKVEAVAHSNVEIDIREILETALSRVGGYLPSKIKGVKRLMNEKRLPEPLEKGIIRARYDLSLFKDGTIRFDITDTPLTHFKPSEVGVSPDRLRELGYSYDKDGLQLESHGQLLELKVQDVVIPEECGEHLVKVSRFIDDLLTNFYGVEPFYKIRDRGDVVGHLVLGLAPHTSAAVVGRVIGYTKTRVCYANPLWHAAKRRNCDGDEDAIIMALDPLLNFSREFLPEQIGGLMDAPLYIIPVINPSEVDKEAHNLDVMHRYPPEFYRLCGEKASPNVYSSIIDTIGARLGTDAQFQGFNYTDECSDINQGSYNGAYTSLRTMLEKLESQMELSEKLKAVEAETIAQKVLTSHFMKDIIGNLRAFTSQTFRCGKCNRRYRRIPLKGVCLRCGGSLMLTVHKGGIEKYIDPALKLVKKYRLDEYYVDRLQLVKDEIDSLFPRVEVEEETKKQIDLSDFLKG